ncbi:unnamed protein product [Prorocentrum cordatum]|uniref:Uncharacterized protein n=1 Tax=Prorocentrum cordatum TaxID=2364126 RepID=A0ABN9XVQ2_9DINO|nr:unnamed protein product [Polarella glacialis]
MAPFGIQPPPTSSTPPRGSPALLRRRGRAARRRDILQLRARPCCAVETWGRVDGRLGGLLDDLAVLAAHRQRERGLLPTRWRAKWRTQISVQLALGVSRALLDALPAGVKPCGPLRSRE